MNTKEIEKQIVAKVLNHYKDFDRAVLNIFDYTLTEITGFSFPLNYFKDNSILDLPTNFSIGDDIQLLLNLMFKEGLKTNKGTLTIYPNGLYESSFIWDEAANTEKFISDLEGYFRWLYQNVCYKIKEVFMLEKKWASATLIMEFKEGKIQPLQVNVPFEGNILHFSFGVEEMESHIYGEPNPELIANYEYVYQETNHPEIKDKLYGNWTKLTIHIDLSDNGAEFNPENYVFE